VAWYISRLLKICLTLNNFNKIFGFQKNDYNCNLILINCLLLCARYVIYRCKYANRIPTIFEFSQMIKNVKFNELTIAQRNNKLELYRKKWNLLFWFILICIIIIKLHCKFLLFWTLNVVLLIFYFLLHVWVCVRACFCLIALLINEF